MRKAQDLLKQAQDRFKDRDYNNAAELSRKALERARDARGMVDEDEDKSDNSGSGPSERGEDLRSRFNR